MNILVTGATGFIGSYFVRKYGLKNDIKTFSFLNDDFSSLKLEPFDTIVHLSALVHQMNGANLSEYEKINVTQTLMLAKKAKASGVKQFIFMSSVKVYGEERDRAYDEMSECKPTDAYGISKLKAEEELEKLSADTFNVAIIRTPIVYGFGVKANIRNLISLVNKVPVLPFAGIKNKRSMVYVGNLCHLIDTLVDKSIGGVFLASDDRPMSTTNLIELIALELNKKNYLIKVPFFRQLLKTLKPSFYQRLYGSLAINNKKTKELLGLTNPYSVEKGIQSMIYGEEK